MDSFPTLYALEADVLKYLFFEKNDYCWYEGAVFIDDDGPKEYNYGLSVKSNKDSMIELCKNNIKWAETVHKNAKKLISENKSSTFFSEHMKHLKEALEFEINATPEQKREREINDRLEMCKQAMEITNKSAYIESYLEDWRLHPDSNDKLSVVIEQLPKKCVLSGISISRDSLLFNIPDNIQKDWLDVIRRTINMIGKEMIPSDNWEEEDYSLIEKIKNKVNSMEGNPVVDVKIPELDPNMFEVLTEEEYFDRYYPKEFGDWKEFYNIGEYRKKTNIGIAWMCYKKYGFLCKEEDGKMKVTKWSVSPYIDSLFMECRMSGLCPYKTQDNKWWAQVTLRKMESNLDLYEIHIEGCDDSSWSLHILGNDAANGVMEKLKKNITMETINEMGFFFTN